MDINFEFKNVFYVMFKNFNTLNISLKYNLNKILLKLSIKIVKIGKHLILIYLFLF